MAKKTEQKLKYTVVTIAGIKYYRARRYDADGKRFDINARSVEELEKKVEETERRIEDIIFRRQNPTVKEYCEKWLEMQAANIRPSTLRGYTYAVGKYIITPLGDMYLSDVTADDIKLAMVPVSKKAEGVYNTVNMLFKSIFYSAEHSKVIADNPTKRINSKGGVPQKERVPLTDEQVKLLLDTIRDRESRSLLTETAGIKQNRAENAKPSQFSRMFSEVPGSPRRDKRIQQALIRRFQTAKPRKQRLSGFFLLKAFAVDKSAGGGIL